MIKSKNNIVNRTCSLQKEKAIIGKAMRGKSRRRAPEREPAAGGSGRRAPAYPLPERRARSAAGAPVTARASRAQGAQFRRAVNAGGNAGNSGSSRYRDRAFLFS